RGLLGVQAADAGADRAADPVGVLADLDAGVVDRLLRRRQREVDEPGGAAGDVVQRVEPPDLRRDADCAVEPVESTDAGVARADVRPGLVDGQPAWRDRAHACDDDSPAIAHIPRPPSTASTSPVTNAAASDTRKRTARATSSGSPSRPSGVAPRIASRAASGRASVSSVAM